MAAVRTSLGLILLTICGAAAASDEVTFVGLSESTWGAAFDNGYVVGWNRQDHGVILYARDGHRLFGISTFSVPGDGMAHPLSAAVDTDGTLVLAYEGPISGEGIALFDQTGKATRVMKTRPYRPSQVCFAPDHSIWMLGYEDPLPETGDFPIFRHYSREGQQLGAFVPRSELLAWGGERADNALFPIVGFWSMRATKDRIGAVLHVAGLKRTWVELDLNGNLIGHWTYDLSWEESFEPAAFTDRGSLYGNHWIGLNRDGIFIFDKATSTWKPVPSLEHGHLIGADGDRLVRQSFDHLHWLKEPEPEAIASAPFTK